MRDPQESYWNAVVILMSYSVDPTPPVCTPPDDISRTIPLGSGTISLTWTEPRATDNCGQVTLQSRNYEPGDQFGRGTTTVTYVFVDSSQNRVSCSFTVTIEEGKESIIIYCMPLCKLFEQLYNIRNTIVYFDQYSMVTIRITMKHDFITTMTIY